MNNGKEPRWQELCAQAAVEHDPNKLLQLVTEINQMLDFKGVRARELTEQYSSAAKFGG